MNLNYEELKASAEQTAETEMAVAEATDAAPTEAGRAPRSAMEEFVQFKKAERDLMETIQEERGPSLAESLKEVLADPDIRGMLAELWYGPENTDRGRAATPTETVEAVEPEPPQPDMNDQTESATDGGVEQLDLDFSGLDPDKAMGLFEALIGTLHDIDPDMTMDEANQYAQLIQLSTAQAAAERPDAEVSFVHGNWSMAKGQVKEEITAYIEQFQ